MSRAYHALLLLAATYGNAAHADCPTSPENWDAEDCDVGGTAVCSFSGTVWTCDISTATQGSAIHAVDDFDTTNHVVEAWGNLDGTLFCCGTELTTPSEVVLEGSDYADSLSFTFSSLTYNLCLEQDTVVGTINGNDGLDLINGSDCADSDYSETLNGDAHDDTIKGNGGDDTLNGGSGEDTMMGGAGDDEMNGNADGDTMEGGPGDDTMNGDGGIDRMSGDDGDDTMNGGTGGDVMCGNAETAPVGDSLDDGDTDSEANPDILYASNANDTDTCGSSSTYWDGNASTGGCTGNPIQSTLPTQCP